MTTYAAAKLTQSGNHMQAFGNVVQFFDTVTITAALATTDRVDLIRIPAGTALTKLECFTGDLDTGTGALVGKLGWRSASGKNIVVGSAAAASSDDDAFGTGIAGFAAATTLGGTPLEFAFEPITFHDDVIITLTPTTAANAMAAAKTVTTLATGIAIGVR